MLETILVALDGSDLSEHVIHTVLQELQLKSATKVVLAHVVPTAGADLDVAADRPQTEVENFPHLHAEKQLQSYQTQLPCESELEIVSGDPIEEIIRLANIHQASLIVIGSRGLTGLNRILQGSVSSQVAADAPCSVLVVKPK